MCGSEKLWIPQEIQTLRGADTAEGRSQNLSMIESFILNCGVGEAVSEGQRPWPVTFEKNLRAP